MSLVLKFGTKNAIFGYFGHILRLKFAIKIFTFQNQHLPIYQNAKFHAKRENFKFGTENILFMCFWDVILKNYYHI